MLTLLGGSFWLLGSLLLFRYGGIMARRKGQPSATYEERVEAEIRRERAKKALGLQRWQKLPRCGHKIKSKVKRFEDAGDFSHSAKDHYCPECTCQMTAGSGTDHFGVGWCYRHERAHWNKTCDDRVRLMTEAIRAGLPERAYQYTTSDAVLKKIQEDAID